MPSCCRCSTAIPYPRRSALRVGRSRAELATRRQQVGLHPPKRAIDIPEPYPRQYWDLMPIHKERGSRDFETTAAYSTDAVSRKDELARRADMAAMARLLVETQTGDADAVSDQGVG